MSALNKNHKKRFKKAVTDLNKLMEDIKVEFPDAKYHFHVDNLHIMDGPSHDSLERMNPGVFRVERSLAEKTLWEATKSN